MQKLYAKGKKVKGKAGQGLLAELRTGAGRRYVFRSAPANSLPD
jgi:hypothetical protein